MFGIIEINGRKYIERSHSFTDQVDITADGQEITRSLTLPGEALFLLRGLTRETVVSGAPAVRRFSFRLGNSDGAVWYVSGGINPSSDRILDSLYFGDGRFPGVISAPVLYGKNASIRMEIEDISLNQPYTIYFGFIGSYLVPTDG